MSQKNIVKLDGPFVNQETEGDLRAYGYGSETDAWDINKAKPGTIPRFVKVFYTHEREILFQVRIVEGAEPEESFLMLELMLSHFKNPKSVLTRADDFVQARNLAKKWYETRFELAMPIKTEDEATAG